MHGYSVIQNTIYPKLTCNFFPPGIPAKLISHYYRKGNGKVFPVHDTRAYRGRRGVAHSFLTSALDVSAQIYAPAALPPGKNRGPRTVFEHRTIQPVA
jgi:hypothetical protein